MTRSFRSGKFLGMEVSLKESIIELGFSKVSREAGIPVSTIWRWIEKGEIPGEDGKHDYRARQLKRAVQKLQSDAA